MKTYLLKTLFGIKNHSKNGWDCHVTEIDQLKYQEMQDISIASFNRFLKGDWELVDIRQPDVSNLQEAFRQTAQITKDLYHKEPCNIVYVDPDVLCVRPCHIDNWNSFNEFRLFDDYVNQISYNNDFYWNCSIRYFPAGLDHFWWKNFDELYNNWNYGKYGYEQLMYWQLMWKHQLLDTKNTYQGTIKLNYPPGQDIPDDFCDNILHDTIHFAASQNPKIVLTQMKKVRKLLGF